MDPFLLASWALEVGSAERVLDCGSGSGIMALLLSNLGYKVTGVEIRQEWIGLARKSALESNLKVDFIEGDIRKLSLEKFDLVLLNPPFFKSGSGPISPDPWKAAAKSELNGTLFELCMACSKITNRICVIVPQVRSRDCHQALLNSGFSISRKCDIDDSLTLYEGIKGETKMLFYEKVQMRSDGSWSLRVKSWYSNLKAYLKS